MRLILTLFFLSISTICSAGDNWKFHWINVKDSGGKDFPYVEEITEILNEARPSDASGIKSGVFSSKHGSAIHLSLWVRQDRDMSIKWTYHSNFSYRDLEQQKTVLDLVNRLPDNIAILGIYPNTESDPVLMIAERIVASIPDGAQRVPGLEKALLVGGHAVSKVGSAYFGQLIADMSVREPRGRRNSHAWPLCIQDADGSILAFYSNSEDHQNKSLGWSEYVISSSGGLEWSSFKELPFSKKMYDNEKNLYNLPAEGFLNPSGDLFLVTNGKSGQGDAYHKVILRRAEGEDDWKEVGILNNTLLPQHRRSQVHAIVSSPDRSQHFMLLEIAGNSDGTDYQHAVYTSKDSSGQIWLPLLQDDVPMPGYVGYGALALLPNGDLIAGASDDRHPQNCQKDKPSKDCANIDQSLFHYAVFDASENAWISGKTLHLDKSIRDPEIALLDGRYYLHGRSGDRGRVSPEPEQFVIYQSKEGSWQGGDIQFGPGVLVSTDRRHHDGYSDNCTLFPAFSGSGSDGIKNAIMVLYSVVYNQPNTSEYAFYIVAEKDAAPPN